MNGKLLKRQPLAYTSEQAGHNWSQSKAASGLCGWNMAGRPDKFATTRQQIDPRSCSAWDGRSIVTAATKLAFGGVEILSLDARASLHW